MKVLASTGRDDVAMVYIVQYDSGKMVECVESVQPPIPRARKWVLLVSTLFGCPIGCAMCDAGGHYEGKLTPAEIFAQIDFLIRRRFPDGQVPCQQFKIQFARMGEPALNPHVLTVLEELPQRYAAPGLMPSLSTVAPRSATAFFDHLLRIKRAHYARGNFQLQFSLHASNEEARQALIPVKTWSFSEIAAYGADFYRPGDRKITLNFALAQGVSILPDALLRHFSPDLFLIKTTPLNPTYRARENNLVSSIDPWQEGADCPTLSALRAAGYEVLLSIGAAEENVIGSNCGQYLKRHLAASTLLTDAYRYDIEAHADGLAPS